MPVKTPGAHRVHKRIYQGARYHVLGEFKFIKWEASWEEGNRTICWPQSKQRWSLSGGAQSKGLFASPQSVLWWGAENGEQQESKSKPKEGDAHQTPLKGRESQ